MTEFELHELQMLRWGMTQGGMQIVHGYRTIASDLDQPEFVELADYISRNSRLGWE